MIRALIPGLWALEETGKDWSDFLCHGCGDVGDNTERMSNWGHQEAIGYHYDKACRE